MKCLHCWHHLPFDYARKHCPDCGLPWNQRALLDDIIARIAALHQGFTATAHITDPTEQTKAAIKMLNVYQRMGKGKPVNCRRRLLIWKLRVRKCRARAAISYLSSGQISLLALRLEIDAVQNPVLKPKEVIQTIYRLPLNPLRSPTISSPSRKGLATLWGCIAQPIAQPRRSHKGRLSFLRGCPRINAKVATNVTYSHESSNSNRSSQSTKDRLRYRVHAFHRRNLPFSATAPTRQPHSRLSSQNSQR